MARLSKAQAKVHQQACDVLLKETLTEDDRDFVFQNWNEGANHVNSMAGAFFTPLDLALDFAIEAFSGRIIDLCAGIGVLSYATQIRQRYNKGDLDLTCIEINPDYIEVGKKVLPEATWIQASVFDVLDMNLDRFDCAISNPPFGAVKRPFGKTSPRYSGRDFEFHVIDIAAHLADYGVFIVPQMSAGFKYSGQHAYERQTSGKAVDFQKQTNLHFEAGCGVDTSIFQDSWRGVSPLCEILCVDFSTQDLSTESDQLNLFEAA